MDRNTFVQEWSSSLLEGIATLFVGAGVSMGAGYPSWKKLLHQIADELKLDIDQEHDLAAVAQHHINKHRSKGRLTKIIAKEFPKRPVPRVLRTIARLPLKNVWTTNWDELIETAFREARREPSVKERAGNLTYELPGTDVNIYKMHGSIRELDDVVLATDDFELYRINREAYLRILAGHLISTSFLFIGVSFSDPNLSHLLAGIREISLRYSSSAPGRTHYAVLRSPQLADFSQFENSSDRLATAVVRHQLFTEDLKRYQIQSIDISRWSELDEIADQIENNIAMNSVFVSGSLNTGIFPPEEEAKICEIATETGRAVANAGKKLISGYGHGLGNHVLSGMLRAEWIEHSAGLDRRLTIRPFPQKQADGFDKQLYRENLVSPAGTVIVVCGTHESCKPGEPTTSPGVREEVEIARRLGRLIIPIGASGGEAERIWNELENGSAPLDQRIGQKRFSVLGSKHSTPEQIGNVLSEILCNL